jgi:hypothetical protein
VKSNQKGAHNEIGSDGESMISFYFNNDQNSYGSTRLIVELKWDISFVSMNNFVSLQT